MNILIAEDEQDTLQLLSAYFRARGHQVMAAPDGSTALALFEAKRPDLVLLDIRMPSINGWDVLERVRRQSGIPVLVISALDGSEDAVRGLVLGADDYLRKPFDLSELDARIQAIMRRMVPARTEPLLQVGPLSIDDRSKQVVVDGREVTLSPREYALLKLLASAPGRVFGITEIVERVWPPDSTAGPADVKQYVHLLRLKVEPDPGSPSLVQTIKGFGYKLEV